MTTAASVLARLPPTRTVLCCCVGEKVFGLAVSDPYLSHARPLVDVFSLSDVDAAIVEHNAGAIFFAGQALPSSKWPVPFCAIPSVTRQEAVRAKEVEMWEGVEISEEDEESLSTQAAMALNFSLWDYGQGWRNNTFG